MNPKQTPNRLASLLAIATVVLVAAPVSAQLPRPGPVALPTAFCFADADDLRGMVSESDVDVPEPWTASLDPAAVLGPVAPGDQTCGPPSGPGAPPSVPQDCQVAVAAMLGLPWPSHSTAGLETFCQKLKEGAIPDPDLPVVPDPGLPLPGTWRELCEAVCQTPPPPGVPAVGVGPEDVNCVKSQDDKGLGGTHVSCLYSCPKNAELTIVVHASDGGATAYGETSCANQKAWCNNGTPNCVGISKGLTSFRAENVACRGHSDEFWDSPVTVACSAIGADPCMLIEDLCDLSAAVPLSLCLVGDEAARLLAGQVSFIVFTFDQAGGIAIRGDTGPDGSFGCTVEPLAW